MKFKTIKLTVLDWYIYENQADIDEDRKLGTVDVCGFLIDEDDEKIEIARSIFTSHDNDVRGTVVIPKACIVSRKIL